MVSIKGNWLRLHVPLPHRSGMAKKIITPRTWKVSDFRLLEGQKQIVQQKNEIRSKET